MLASHPYFQVEQGLGALGTNALPHLIRIIGKRRNRGGSLPPKQKIWNALPGAIQRRYPNCGRFQIRR